MKKLLSFSVFVFMLIFLFSLPFFSAEINASVASGIEIVTGDLFPSLFPFMVISSLLSSFGGNALSRLFSPIFCPLFKISENAVPAIVTGLLGGFPSGAAHAAKLYKENKITKEEANRLPVFSNNAGLMFVMGAVGIGHFSSVKIGLILYFSHIFSSLIAGIMTRKSADAFTEKKSVAFTLPPVSEIPHFFTRAVRESVISMAVISGNFIIFRIISAMLYHFFGNSTVISFLAGLFEVTGGVLSMPETSEGLILSAFLLSFNGLCVHMQSMAFFAPLGLSMKKCLLLKIFCGFLSAFLSFAFVSGGLLWQKDYPSMIFYILSIIIPLMFFLPLIVKKRESDNV